MKSMLFLPVKQVKPINLCDSFLMSDRESSSLRSYCKVANIAVANPCGGSRPEKGSEAHARLEG